MRRENVLETFYLALWDHLPPLPSLSHAPEEDDNILKFLFITLFYLNAEGTISHLLVGSLHKYSTPPSNKWA